MRISVYLTAAIVGLVASAFIAGLQPRAAAHCEVPCGIYGDHARIVQMLEDTDTIARAINEIRKLAGRHDATSVNQAARWVVTKEEHATRIQHTIAQYFMTQRIKPIADGAAGYQDYVKLLTEHHAVMVNAMKTKQDADPVSAQQLRQSIKTIEQHYPASHDHTHGG